jgi:hypothetical protein
MLSNRTRAASLGLHIDHTLTDAEQLLGKELAQTTRTLDRPYAIRPRCRPVLQPLELVAPSDHPDLAEHGLGLVEHHRGMRSLVRVDPDHHASHAYLQRQHRRERPWRARLISDDCARASLEPRHGRDTTSRHLVHKPDQKVGRRFASQPVAPIGRYDQRRTPTVKSQSDGYAHRTDGALGSETV